jgi:hypothetical protein
MAEPRFTQEDGVTLKEYVEARIDAMYHNFEVRIQALEKATTIASESMEKRLEGMNEFRSQLKDQSLTFFTRQEHILYKEAIDNDIRSLRESRANQEGKASQQSVIIAFALTGISLMIGSLSFLLAIVSIILRFLGI